MELKPEAVELAALLTENERQRPVLRCRSIGTRWS